MNTPLGPQPLNPIARVPLYQQLVDRLEQDICHEVSGADKALPSERALVDLLRVLAHKAIDALVAQGRVIRRHGAGNFVAPRLTQSLSRVSDFLKNCASAGFHLRHAG